LTHGCKLGKITISDTTTASSRKNITPVIVTLRSCTCWDQ